MCKTKYLKFSHLFFVTNLGGTSIFDMRDYIQSLISLKEVTECSKPLQIQEIPNNLLHQRSQ